MSRLADENWTVVSVHAPVVAFLKAEWEKEGIARWVDQRLVTAPDLRDDFQNHLRMCLLWAVRGLLLRELPKDTEWFEVQFLRRQHLGELRVIGRCGWEDPTDNNELLKVAERKPLPLQKPLASWDAPLLWGHDQNGPFTILEGNNRLIALAGSKNNEDIELTCYVGLSKGFCFWHLADPLPMGNRGTVEHSPPGSCNT